MKNKLLLNKKFKSYTALAGVLIAGAPAEAQMVYTDVDPDVVLNSSDNYGFDLDNDGTDDFGLTNVLYSGIGAMNVLIYDSAGVAGYSGPSAFPFASAIDAGEVIGPVLGWYSSEGGAPLLWGSFAIVGSFGMWNNVSNKYVGLRIKDGADFHYGWARLDVTHTTVTLKDYAYNATANAAINTTVGIESSDNEFHPTVYAVDQGVHITLPSSVNDAQVSIIDVAGRLLHSEFIIDHADIVLNELPQGMYLVKIESGEVYFSKLVMMK